MSEMILNDKKQSASEETDLVDLDHITIKGARTNNLRNVDLRIPKNKLVVVTGVSGSGKSSITMDTLYAEGQRRYVESLSSYARQFLGRMKKPDVDYIRGICPAIAIEQRVTTGNTRSTVGSMTEVYDFLRLLYARIGKFYSPVSGEIVKKHEVSDVIDHIRQLPEGARGLVLIPFSKKYKERTLGQELNLLLQKGYTRLQFGEETLRIEDVLDGSEKRFDTGQPAYTFSDRDLYVLIDRFVHSGMEESDWMRLADSINTAFFESEGECVIQTVDGGRSTVFNNRFELDGIEFPEPTPQLFNYNNPYGACPTCEGYGRILGIDRDKVVPDKTKSVYDGALAPWKGEKYGEWLSAFLKNAHRFDFPVHTPFEHLSKSRTKTVVERATSILRVSTPFLRNWKAKPTKFKTASRWPVTAGAPYARPATAGGLRQEALCVRISGKNISELTGEPLDEVLSFFETLELERTRPAGGQTAAARNTQPPEIHGRTRPWAT
jgi:excinuclease ABC subunit A